MRKVEKGEGERRGWGESMRIRGEGRYTHDSRHVSLGIGTCEHNHDSLRISHGTHMNEPWRMYERVLLEQDGVMTSYICIYLPEIHDTCIYICSYKCMYTNLIITVQMLPSYICM